mmetsp:Transcript_8368/g.25082  ORF Transcript_8368/g.25082 Transcript_8368/m.25082 type:complete len:219 (-) Transcript_8368:932-1588(-)
METSISPTVTFKQFDTACTLSHPAEGPSPRAPRLLRPLHAAAAAATAFAQRQILLCIRRFAALEVLLLLLLDLRRSAAGLGCRRCHHCCPIGFKPCYQVVYQQPAGGNTPANSFEAERWRGVRGHAGRHHSGTHGHSGHLLCHRPRAPHNCCPRKHGGSGQGGGAGHDEPVGAQRGTRRRRQQRGRLQGCPGDGQERRGGGCHVCHCCHGGHGRAPVL